MVMTTKFSITFDPVEDADLVCKFLKDHEGWKMDTLSHGITYSKTETTFVSRKEYEDGQNQSC